MKEQPKQGSLALAIVGSIIAGIVWFRRHDPPSDDSPFIAVVTCLSFLLFVLYVGGSILFPDLWSKRGKDSARRRVALQRRRIGGFTWSHKQCLRIDQEGIFETRLGMIAWSQVLGLSAQTLIVNDVEMPLLRVYLRDPWRYLENETSALMAYGYRMQLARDARHGRIDIVTRPYRVDVETACEVARELRKGCAEPWIEDWSAATSAAVVEQRLREFELLAATQLEAPPPTPAVRATLQADSRQHSASG